MNLRYCTLISSLSALAVGGALLAPARANAAEQGMEELTRGPVHEAFAATVSFDPEPGMFVRTAPPGMIEEIPPEQRLEGDNVSWIPGYWGWDGEQNDFIWISGVWRNLPPGRQWVPGYWGQAESQWQWTSGYWADEAVREVSYLPKPPKSIESGPNTDAPSRNHIWISGTWVDRDDRYAWRPGYWEPGQENWTWIPAHYQWTRRGYVFIDGYWDYDVDRRGVVFAPVRFQHGYYDRPDFTYTPLMVISLSVFANHLFVRPSYGHYYFGDYYSPRYRDEGFFASFSYRTGRNVYDPIYAQSRWEHRDDRGWERGRRENFDFYRDNRDARPPLTWAAMQARPADKRGGQRDNYQFAEPLAQYVNRPAAGQRFEAVSAESRSRIVEQRQQVREFGKERQQLESRPVAQAAQGADKGLRVSRENFGKSPVMGKRAGQLSGNDAPPQRREPKSAEPREPKSAGPEGKGGNISEAPKQARQPGREMRGESPQPDAGRGKKNEAGPQPNGAAAARSEPAMPARKQAVQPERQPQQRQKVEPQPTRQPEQQPRQKAAPQPAPQKAAQPEQRQKAEPQPNRQPEQQPRQKAAPQPVPQKAAQPEQRQKAEPQPQRAAEPPKQQRVQPQQPRPPEPQRQTKPAKAADAPNKNSAEGDPDDKKNKR